MQIQIDESQIPESDRIPRFTSASWKYENGAIGHLEHGVSLQGTEFNTELVVYADGWMMKLVDPCECIKESDFQVGHGILSLG